MSILLIFCFCLCPCRYCISSIVFHSLPCARYPLAIGSEKEGRKGTWEKYANMKFQNLKILRDKEVVCGMGQEVDANMPTLLTRSCAFRFSDMGGCWVSNHRHRDTYSSSLLLGHLLYPWLQNDPARHMLDTWQGSMLLDSCCRIDPVSACTECIWVGM